MSGTVDFMLKFERVWKCWVWSIRVACKATDDFVRTGACGRLASPPQPIRSPSASFNRRLGTSLHCHPVSVLHRRRCEWQNMGVRRSGSLSPAALFNAASWMTEGSQSISEESLEWGQGWVGARLQSAGAESHSPKPKGWVRLTLQPASLHQPPRWKLERYISLSFRSSLFIILVNSSCF